MKLITNKLTKLIVCTYLKHHMRAVRRTLCILLLLINLSTRIVHLFPRIIPHVTSIDLRVWIRKGEHGRHNSRGGPGARLTPGGQRREGRQGGTALQHSGAERPVEDGGRKKVPSEAGREFEKVEMWTREQAYATLYKKKPHNFYSTTTLRSGSSPTPSRKSSRERSRTASFPY